MWNLKKKAKLNKNCTHRYRDQILQSEEGGDADEGGSKVQTSSYKSRGYNTQHGDYSKYCTVALKVVESSLKSSHHKKKHNCVVMNANQTYCGDYFAIYTDI